MATRQTQPRMSGLVKALEDVWSSAIVRAWPDVPKSVMITVSSGGKQAKMKYAHFAPGRWQDRRPNQKNGKPSRSTRKPRIFHEVSIVGEHLNRPAEEVFGSLLHESVHARAEALGIKDTSRGGRYHNAQFRNLAEEMGLEVLPSDSKSVGFGFTKVPPATCKKYVASIRKIREAQKVFRAFDPDAASKIKDRNYVKCVCECSPPRTIRVSKATIEEGGIGCGFCGGEFGASS